MTLWRSKKESDQPATRLHIEDGTLYYYREKGALTRLQIDALKYCELRVIFGEVYWYLVDEANAFALIPERYSDIAKVRQYLSQWRGFNYDGLCRFEPEAQASLQLWPLPRLDANAVA